MSTLADTVADVVKALVDKDELFTALDVSNAVKVTNPLARHSEIRDIVRGIYNTDMKAVGYTRTPIQVSLEDGSKTEALLYHPLHASWDITTKYDDQRRAAKPATPHLTLVVPPAPVAAPVVAQISAIVPTKKKPTQVVAAPASPIASASPTVAATPKQLWDNLFSPTRLFPKF